MNPTDAHPSPGLFRRTLRRWGRPIVATWLVGSVALMAAADRSIRPVYRAVSYLRVNAAATNLYGITTGNEQIDPFLKTQVHLIKSPNVLTAAGINPKASVLKRIQTAGDVVIELQKALSVSVVPETYLIEVAMSSPSASEAATLVNAVVDAFIEANVEWSDGITRAQIRNLETYLGDLKNQSDELERRWRELVARGHNDAQVLVKEKQVDGTTKTEAQGAKRSSLTLDQYRQLQRVLFEVGLELTRTEATVASRKAASMVEGKPPGSGAEVVESAERIAALRDKLDAVRQVAKEDDPAVRVASKKLDDALGESKRRAIRAEILAEQDQESDLRAAEGRTRDLRAQQVALQAEFGKLQIDDPKQSSDAVDIEVLREQRANLMSMQDPVRKRLEQLKFEAKGEARIRAVNRAVPPGRPIEDRRLPVLAGLPLLMVPLVFALFAGIEAIAGPRPDPARMEPPAQV